MSKKKEVIDLVRLKLEQIKIKTVVDIEVKYFQVYDTHLLSLQFDCGYNLHLLSNKSTRELYPPTSFDRKQKFIDKHNLSEAVLSQLENELKEVIELYKLHYPIQSTVSTYDNAIKISDVINKIKPFLLQMQMNKPLILNLNRSDINHFDIELSFNNIFSVKFNVDEARLMGNKEPLNQYLMFNNLKQSDFTLVGNQLKEMIKDLNTHGCYQHIDGEFFLIGAEIDELNPKALTEYQLDMWVEEMENSEF